MDAVKVLCSRNLLTALNLLGIGVFNVSKFI